MPAIPPLKDSMTGRLVCGLLSLVAHVCLGLALLSSPILRLVPEPPPQLEIDLTRLDAEIPMEAPAPKPVEKVAEKKPPAPKAGTIRLTQKPEARSAPRPADAPPPAEPPAKAAPAPELSASPAPAVAPKPRPKAIAVKTSKDAKPAEKPITRTIAVNQGDSAAHRGAEARFGRSLFADFYSYSPDEFAGQFRTAKGREVSIIDARKGQQGRFILWDSKVGKLRRLKKYNKYIYTIGPSLDADEPIEGSVTFLARDDHIERFIYILKDENIGMFPSKVRFGENSMALKVKGGKLEAVATLPKTGDSENTPAAVLVSGPQCLPLSMLQGLSRRFGMTDMGLLTYLPRGCGEGKKLIKSGKAYARDVLSAYHSLGEEMHAPGKLGIIAVGEGIAAALRSFALPSREHPAYLICVVSDTLGPETFPALDDIKRLAVPSMWFFTGKTENLAPTIRKLETLRNGGSPVSIVVDEIPASHENPWLSLISSDFATVARSWVETLP